MNKDSNHKIWWDEKNKIGREYSRGIYDESKVISFGEQVRRMSQESDQHIDWICEIYDVNSISSKARKILVDLIKEENNTKFALVGASLILRTITNFILSAVGKNNVRHFKTIKEALKWIKENEE
jgi:hypothetical protein